jgi:energy-coupling factor transporter transmembrane protein EcfT
MHLKATLIKLLKLFGGDTRRAIVGYIVVGLIVAAGGVLVLTKTALTFLIQISNIQTPLWATIFLILLCGLYTYLKTRQRQNTYDPPNIQEELHEEFGAYWNKQYKTRCLYCKYPLKCASKQYDPSVFFCSNCNRKHALRDTNGNHITEAQAVEQLKKLPTSGSI